MSDMDRPLSDRELLIRIDTKLDGVIEDKKDHEARLRTIEDKVEHFVTGKQLFVAMAGVIATASASIPIISWIQGK